MSDSKDDSDQSSSSTGSSTDFDFTSTSFQPLRVLYSRKAQIPVPSAPHMDNVSGFESKFRLLGGYDQVFSREKLNEIYAAASSSKKIAVPQGQEPVRRFLPHQGLISAPRPARLQRNIFTKLEQMEGPLECLHRWMTERVRVKVYTRKQKGVRGYVTGFVEIFDKQWNMALSDVFESWRRRKYRYSQNKLCALGEPKDCSDQLAKMGIRLPEVSVKSVHKKYVECTRRMAQIMIRGEQVVLVTPDTSKVVEPVASSS
ncbi:U7 snRNA-associated Sm-like protein LSm11 [Sabethes cyaneus]|uniref:U7 snRNA-associated Sm-like protein LSm11 n=1 Tax=Sabethes cyaneus TaxID=53552 RepID=UPI00237DCAF6|nr:U7 snRNA-associated Sm-like protein LSm11 [Sabethes cyaneus]